MVTLAPLPDPAHPFPFICLLLWVSAYAGNINMTTWHFATPVQSTQLMTTNYNCHDKILKYQVQKSEI